MQLIARLLFSVPVALPNRGGDGLAKVAPLGGVLRQRISSQSIKRRLRQSASMEALAKEIGHPLSVRSRIAVERIVVKRLVDGGVAEAVANDLASVMQDVLTRGIDKAKERRNSAAAKRKNDRAARLGDTIQAQQEDDTGAMVEEAQIVTLGHGEINAIGDAVLAAAKAQLDGTKLLDELAKGSKSKFPGIAALTTVCDGSRAGIDGLLFGRMSTGDIISACDAVVAVSHAVTVHELQDVTDYLTAVDDLDPDRGAAHLDTTHLASGVFALDVILDLDGLLKAMGEEHSRAAVRGLLTAAMTYQPTAKWGSTAPGAALEEAVVELRNRGTAATALAYVEPVAATPRAARERLREWILERDDIEGSPHYPRLTLREVPRKVDDAAIDALARAAADLVAPEV